MRKKDKKCFVELFCLVKQNWPNCTKGITGFRVRGLWILSYYVKGWSLCTLGLSFVNELDILQRMWCVDGSACIFGGA